MAGRPKFRAMVAELERLAREEEFDSVLEFAVAWVESGKTLTDLAHKVGIALSMQVERAKVSQYLYNLSDDAKLRIASARKEGAHGLAEGTMHLEARDKDEAAAARVKMTAAQFLASAWNRDEFGQQKPGVNITLNANSMHLDALRVRAVGDEESERERVALARVQTVDAEVIEDSSAIAGAIASTSSEPSAAVAQG
jgi:hypothetical protein